MTISMYKASVPIFVQFLTSLSAVLDKAAAYAEAKKVEPAVLLNTRLAPDMFPLVRQVRAATDHAINACGRLAGADMPSFSNTETTIPELKDRIAKTIDFLKSLKPAQIDGSEDKAIKITFPSGATREFTGQSLLLTNSLPNFFSTAPPPTTSCAIAASSSASAISWARRSRFSARSLVLDPKFVQHPFVPAKAGTQTSRAVSRWLWIPACAGMNGGSRRHSAATTCSRSRSRSGRAFSPRSQTCTRSR